MELPWIQRSARVAIKRFLYSSLYQRDAFRLMTGGTKPLLQFKVEADPPSVYLNFELDAENLGDLEAELDLPFSLAPIRCLEDDDPFYCLTLNIYRVSGLAIGLRAEWSVYIDNGDGVPRYLVLEAQSNNPSIDSVNLVTRGRDLTHSQKGKSIKSSVLDADGGRFTFTCRDARAGEHVRAAPEWVQANDYIYWLNGVCDRTFYDSGLANAKMRLLDPNVVKIRDSSRWAAIVHREPKHVLVFENAIEFAISPWWNLDEMED